MGMAVSCSVYASAFAGMSRAGLMVLNVHAGKPQCATCQAMHADTSADGVTTAAGKHMNLRVMRRAGKENMTLLNDAADKKDGKASSSSSSSWSEDDDEAVVKGGSAAGNASDVINVFTVASGHMYERLQKIMILSVIKNTKSR